ncbi:MAG: hypothetical protein ACRD68_00170 [Pyrinomonadaceae bacterium]
MLFKVLQLRGEDDPSGAALHRLPEAAPRQRGKLMTQAVDVFGTRVKPDAVIVGLLNAVAECEKEFLVEVDVSEAEHPPDGGAKRGQLFENKLKRRLSFSGRTCSHVSPPE